MTEEEKAILGRGEEAAKPAPRLRRARNDPGRPAIFEAVGLGFIPNSPRRVREPHELTKLGFTSEPFV